MTLALSILIVIILYITTSISCFLLAFGVSEFIENVHKGKAQMFTGLAILTIITIFACLTKEWS